MPNQPSSGISVHNEEAETPKLTVDPTNGGVDYYFLCV